MGVLRRPSHLIESLRMHGFLAARPHYVSWSISCADIILILLRNILSLYIRGVLTSLLQIYTCMHYCHVIQSIEMQKAKFESTVDTGKEISSSLSSLLVRRDRLGAFENRVLRRIFGTKRDEVTEG
jgi:hypothetical protein